MDEHAERLYEVILKAANYFLTNSKRYSIEILAAEDPSYEQIASLTEDLRVLLHSHMDDIDPQLTSQAADYCRLMSDMAKSIVAHDEAGLKRLSAELEKKPFALQ